MNIRLKLQLPLIAISATLLLAVGGLYYFWLPDVDEKATAQIEADTLKQMQVVAAAIAPPLANGNLALIDETLRQVHRRHPHWIELTLRNTDGIRLYPLFGLRSTEDSHHDYIHRVGEALAYRQSVHLTLPIAGTDDKRIGYLQVSVDNHELARVEQATILQAEAILVSLMLVMLFVGLLIQDSWVAKPIRLLVEATRRLSKGDYAITLPIASHDEIGQLAVSFNRMRDKVHRRETSLIEARTEAERLRDTYAALSALNGFIAERPTPSALFRRAGEIILQSLRPDFIWIARVDWERLRLRSEMIGPEPVEERARIEQAIAGIRMDASAESNIFQRLLLSAEVQCLPDIFKEPSLGAWWLLLQKHEINSLALAPIMLQNRVEAIVAVFSRGPQVCSEDKLKLFGELAERIGLSLEDYDNEQELQRHALYDPMTHLPNRTLFMGRLTDLRAKALVHRQSSPFAIGILDLMGLKAINDRLGHNSGDRVVDEAARRLEAFRQGDDLVARLSGDEFGLILYPRAGDPHWHATLSRLLTALGAPLNLPEGEIVNIQAHIGLAQCPGDGRHPESLLRRADLALHEAKLDESSSYRFFRPQLEEQMLSRHRVQREFLESIRACHLVLHYQPKMDVAACRVTGFEALIRWPLADGGYRPANEFIGLVEADGRLIRSLGRYVLEQALSQLTSWRNDGFDTTISINIGARHLLAPEFLQDLDEALDAHPESRHALKLEVTETAYLADLEKTGIRKIVLI
ncbi:diguanylate cyclase domain-containing protein [Acidihalobacter prosperus]|uniref:Diguanylate cyclase/phosphodiesterase (GGDEF & EAL domains) n=1 Tax=Acidihalobacter prosperus TaxID=160660 RepID=A0A1A6C6V7_9GAMM|nr:diguanylate cyclase [Acidihalobacter prosperus]OBS10294.1 diguanylate cyclase/phosphodiesterase (GGDEF & EAL domains) [Acidihalobacter prosperus]